MNNKKNCAVQIVVRERGDKNNRSVDSVIDYGAAQHNIVIVDDRPFTFDHVLGTDVTQQQLFDDLIKPLVEKVEHGFNCTALAYGQTGTGKTYTMGFSTNTNLDKEHVGIIPRCLHEILSPDSKENTMEREIHISFLEIYNEKVYDLFSDNTTEPITSRGSKNIVRTLKLVRNIEECNQIIAEGNKNRHVRPTKMNAESSRSHAVFTIQVRTIVGDQVKTSNFNLVDLAGSEGVRRTGHEGVAKAEGVNINQGLLCITKVLHAMAQGHKVIPYRDSVLSLVLQDSLSPNSFLTMVACISPNRNDLSETISTLRFAQNAKQVKHTPQMNAIISELRKTRNTPNRMTGIPSSIRKIPYANNSNLNSIKKFSRSDIGLTPKEQQRARLGIVRPTTKPRLTRPYESMHSIYRTSETTNVRESLFDTPSLLSFNATASTAVNDTIMQQHPNDETRTATARPTSSDSSIVRKCMEQFETVVPNIMMRMLETMQGAATTMAAADARDNTILDMHTPNGMPNQTAGPLINTAFRSEMKNIMKEILLDNNSQPRQLFATSSPIFKMPEPPKPKTDIINGNNKVVNVSGDSNTELSLTEPTVMPMPIRRSQRISKLFGMNDSSINSTATMNDSVIRRSMRLSIKRKRNDDNQSVRLLESIDEKAGNDQRKTRIPSRSYRKTMNMDNSIIDDYLNSNDGNKKMKTLSQKARMSKHQQGLLELLNKGTFKQLQVLPQIGSKTAYQLITQRSLHGNYKSLASVEKLPIWRGDGWNRFAKANMLK